MEGKENLSESQWDILLRIQGKKRVGNRKREGPQLSWRTEAERRPSLDESVYIAQYQVKQGNRGFVSLESRRYNRRTGSEHPP